MKLQFLFLILFFIISTNSTPINENVDDRVKILKNYM